MSQIKIWNPERIWYDIWYDYDTVYPVFPDTRLKIVFSYICLTKNFFLAGFPENRILMIIGTKQRTKIHIAVFISMETIIFTIIEQFFCERQMLQINSSLSLSLSSLAWHLIWSICLSSMLPAVLGCTPCSGFHPSLLSDPAQLVPLLQDQLTSWYRFLIFADLVNWRQRESPWSPGLLASRFSSGSWITV